MKRKFKLFATVASLCLSVALMAFGVYAAATVQYTVGSTVSFASQVDVKWTAGAYTATGGDETKLWDYDGDTITGTANSAYYHEFDPQATDPTAEDQWMGTNIAFESGKQTVVYRFTCKNEGSNDITVAINAASNTLVDQALDADPDGLLAVSVNHGVTTVGSQNAEIADLTSVNIGARETYVWEVTVTLGTITHRLNDTQTTLNIVFTATEAIA